MTRIKRIVLFFVAGFLNLPASLLAHGDVVDEHPEELVAVQTITQNSAGQKLGLALVSLVLIAVLAWLVRKFINRPVKAKEKTNLR